MDIEITPQKSDGLERLIQVRVPAEAVRDAEDQAARRYASTVRLPGFRPGKAPAAMIKRRFKDAIRQQVLESLVQEAFKEVMDREKYDVASQPHVHDVKFEEGQPLSFELHLEIRPEITINRTSGFQIERKPAEVTDATVTEQLDQMREQKAAWSPVEEKPRPGDMVTVQLALPDESGSLAESKEYRIVLGGDQAIPGVEELIMTLSPGETAEREVRWPDDFPDESQRGVSKPVRVTLEEVKRKALPALDDDFAREVGDFESLDALKAAVRKDLEANAEREADASVRQQLVEQIIAANPFDVPPSWVSQLVNAYLQAYQIPEEGSDRFRQEFRPMAERQVRRDLVVETIARKEGLAATEADVDGRVAEVAAARNVEPGEVYASLQKAGRLKEIEQGITEDKVFKWLIDQNS
jgi:trigger factor